MGIGQVPKWPQAIGGLTKNWVIQKWMMGKGEGGQIGNFALSAAANCDDEK
jgi:hypothetical protein